jgi:hypothetical protein
MNLAFFSFCIACGDSTAQSNMSEQTASTNPVKTNAPATENQTTKPAPSTTAPSTPSPSDTVQHGSNTSGMPNLLKGIATDGCDNGPGIYGAADYFYNEFSISGTDVTGTETWILYPNKKMQPKWAEEGIQDSCKVTWNLKGKTQPVGRKGDLGIRVVNELITTTCPKEIVNKYEDTGKTITYDVLRSSDTTAKFFFSKSGKYVGSGHHKGDNLQFITEKSCRWF